MWGRVEVLALLASAPSLDEVHAHGDRVVSGIDHRAVLRVPVATVKLAPGAVASLEIAAHLTAQTLD